MVLAALSWLQTRLMKWGAFWWAGPVAKIILGAFKQNWSNKKLKKFSYYSLSTVLNSKFPAGKLNLPKFLNISLK